MYCYVDGLELVPEEVDSQRLERYELITIKLPVFCSDRPDKRAGYESGTWADALRHVAQIAVTLGLGGGECSVVYMNSAYIYSDGEEPEDTVSKDEIDAGLAPPNMIKPAIVFGLSREGANGLVAIFEKLI